jgi:glycosyltransferase involved in cell wall biosynthesis
MRLLHIHSGNLYGGVETVLRTMARSQRLVPGLEMSFALSFDGRIADELRDTGCAVHIIGAVKATNPFSVLRARTRLAELCRAETCDATIAHSPWTLSLLAPAATRPLVYYQHDVIKGRHWTERLSARPDLLLANSSFTAGTSGNLFPGFPVSVVHPPAELLTNGNRVAERQAIRRKFGAPEGSLVILQAARFEPWKGHRLLLEALAVLQRNPDWFLWIAGEPQRAAEKALRAELAEYAGVAGIGDRIAFVGHVSDMPAVMNAADVYCQPNQSAEPFGLTFIEALHAELTVIATNLGGAREILAPDFGVLVEPDRDALASALERVLRHPELRESLSRRGPLRARVLCDPRAQMEAFVRAVGCLRRTLPLHPAAA